MYHYTTFNPSTGEITGVLSTTDTEHLDALCMNQPYITGSHDGSQYYIKNKLLTPRPPMRCSLTRTPSGFILRDVPISSTVTLSCSVFTEEYTVSDGTFEYEGRWPDTLKVTISSFPYIDRTEEVRPNES